jgi:cytochrome b involved in lipid metabolism
MKTSFALFVFLASVVSPRLAASQTVEQSNQRLLDESREISVAELATHSTYETGLWAALNDVVYDLTDFVHPGATRKILKVGGLDATATYLENYPRVHPFSIDE